ncbi:asparaginase [Niveispirillum fermenti]|uniref:asparaginase n=1 Tax=Niveispirillum fermenti TaxID=1233113 RepID=UPI003A890E96
MTFLTGNHPLLSVAVTRGGCIESRHRVAVSLVGPSGPVAAWGDVDAPVYSRSALKPLQALALLDHQPDLDRRRLALACASHNGEAVHTELALAWLADLGLGAGALECGAHDPIDTPTARALDAAGCACGRQHNNCSGKHCGFLALARHLGVDPAGYTHQDHPVQVAMRRAAEPFLGLDLEAVPWGIDGCGAPNPAVPLRTLAGAFARLASQGNGPSRRIFDAMAGEPYLVAGRDRFDTAAMQAWPGRVIVKGGAEGVWVAGIAGTGLGLALKVEDGAKRAAEVAIAGLLSRLMADLDALHDWSHPSVKNAEGRQVGDIRLLWEETP